MKTNDELATEHTIESLLDRIETLESTLNELYHSTSCTTYQMELINEVCPQK